jgi:hypothetical protein
VNVGWVGAPTDQGFSVVVEITGPVNIRLAVSTSSDMSSPVFSPQISSADGWNRLDITGLSPNTEYHWSLEEDSVVGSAEGSVRTFPVDGNPANFSFGFASCNTGGSTAITFTRILDRKPRFFMHMGDFHYANITANDPDLFLAQYENNLNSSTQGPMYKNVPVVYVFDDHDFGDNNADGSIGSKPAANLAYRTATPHYPIVFEGPDDNTPITQTFRCGRVRFAMMDTRTHSDHSGPWGTNTFLGEMQLNWLLNLIETFEEPLLVVSVSTPWIYDDGEGSSHKDKWGNAAGDRQLITDAIQAHAKGRVLIIHGDSHMLGMDDGTNSAKYATVNHPLEKGPRVVCSAALDRSTSIKGGPYSEGAWAASNRQYSVIEIDDPGGDYINVTATGYNADNDAAIVSMAWAAGPDPVLTPNIVYWADTVEDADALPSGTVAYVRTDGDNPTRLRRFQEWLDISGLTLSGVDSAWVDTVLTEVGDVSLPRKLLLNRRRRA